MKVKDIIELTVTILGEQPTPSAQELGSRMPKAAKRRELPKAGVHAAKLATNARDDLKSAKENGLGAKRRRRLRRRLAKRP